EPHALALRTDRGFEQLAAVEHDDLLGDGPGHPGGGGLEKGGLLARTVQPEIHLEADVAVTAGPADRARERALGGHLLAAVPRGLILQKIGPVVELVKEVPELVADLREHLLLDRHQGGSGTRGPGSGADGVHALPRLGTRVFAGCHGAVSVPPGAPFRGADPGSDYDLPSHAPPAQTSARRKRIVSIASAELQAQTRHPGGAARLISRRNPPGR